MCVLCVSFSCICICHINKVYLLTFWRWLNVFQIDYLQQKNSELLKQVDSVSTSKSRSLTSLDKRNVELTRELQTVDRMAQQLQKEKDTIVSSADEEIKQAKVSCFWVTYLMSATKQLPYGFSFACWLVCREKLWMISQYFTMFFISYHIICSCSNQ